MMEKWRLIIDPPLTGEENMAVDEALLHGAEASGVILPTLRIYRWKVPTVSIGYLQDPRKLLASGLPLIRRITGGRAVLHDIEITYSVTADLSHKVFSGGVTGSYSAISSCIIDALRRSGADANLSRGRSTSRGGKDACFHAPSRYEVLVDGRKLAGSSQRRFKKAFLQHGSILFGINEELNERVFGRDLINKMSCVSSFTEIGIYEFEKILIEAFARGLDASFTETGLSGEEEEDKESLIKEKYSCSRWNLSCGGCGTS